MPHPSHASRATHWTDGPGSVPVYDGARWRMGGHLTMIATFPDQEPVVLIPSHLAEKATRRANRT